MLDRPNLQTLRIANLTESLYLRLRCGLESLRNGTGLWRVLHHPGSNWLRSRPERLGHGNWLRNCPGRLGRNRLGGRPGRPKHLRRTYWLRNGIHPHRNRDRKGNHRRLTSKLARTQLASLITRFRLHKIRQPIFDWLIIIIDIFPIMSPFRPNVLSILRKPYDQQENGREKYEPHGEPIPLAERPRSCNDRHKRKHGIDGQAHHEEKPGDQNRARSLNWRS